MPVEVKRYKCAHCKKHFSSKSYASQHEHKCFFNPDRKTCPTCKHFNGCYKPDTAKCYKLNRKNETSIEHNTVFGELTINKFDVFTEFLIYNCPDWESEYEIEEE